MIIKTAARKSIDAELEARTRWVRARVRELVIAAEKAGDGGGPSTLELLVNITSGLAGTTAHMGGRIYGATADNRALQMVRRLEQQTLPEIVALMVVDGIGEGKKTRKLQ